MGINVLVIRIWSVETTMRYDYSARWNDGKDHSGAVGRTFYAIADTAEEAAYAIDALLRSSDADLGEYTYGGIEGTPRLWQQVPVTGAVTSEIMQTVIKQVTERKFRDD